MTDHKELVEKVARALDTWVDPERIRTAIALIRAEALEEATLVADRMSREWATEWHRTLKVDEHMEGMSDGADDVAAAIRAMKDKQ